MNVIVLTGRVSRAEVKAMGQNMGFDFGIAVTRPYKVNGESVADFFNCVSFNENIVKNVSKWINVGHRVSVQGTVQVNRTDNGTYYNVVVSQITLLETKAEVEGQGQNQQRQQPQQKRQNNQGYQAPAKSIDPSSDLPF